MAARKTTVKTVLYAVVIDESLEEYGLETEAAAREVIEQYFSYEYRDPEDYDVEVLKYEVVPSKVERRGVTVSIG